MQTTTPTVPTVLVVVVVVVAVVVIVVIVGGDGGDRANGCLKPNNLFHYVSSTLEAPFYSTTISCNNHISRGSQLLHVNTLYHINLKTTILATWTFASVILHSLGKKSFHIFPYSMHTCSSQHS